MATLPKVLIIGGGMGYVCTHSFPFFPRGFQVHTDDAYFTYMLI
jgi:hypothetical protein